MIAPVIFLFVGLFAEPSHAEPSRRAPSNTAPSAPASTAPVFTCSIVPAAVPGPGEFQATSATVRLARGDTAQNKQIEIRLGSQSSGTVLGTVCTDNLVRGSATTTVTIAPAITDPNYRWTCNAKQTSTSCPSAPR